MSSCNCNGRCHRLGRCDDDYTWFYPDNNIDHEKLFIQLGGWHSNITVSDIIRDMKRLNDIKKIKEQPFY